MRQMLELEERGEDDELRAVRLQLSITQRARLLEAGWRRVVLLTFVERLLCGKDTNYEEWGQLAMIGRSCIGRREPGQEPRRLQVQLEKACTQNLTGFSDKTKFQT